jgi:hypothetical protein
MSYYQEGYDKGYADGLEGKHNMAEGLIFAAISAVVNDEDQDEWERGYRDGFEAGEEESGS